MSNTHLVLVSLLGALTACSGGSPATSAPEAPVERASPAPPAAPAEAGAKLALEGTITFEGDAQGAAVFVSVKDPAKPGPPLAAKKLPAGPFPLTFDLTEADVVQMGPHPRALPAEVVLTARLDAVGDPMSMADTEPAAELKTPSEAKGITLALKAGG
ncbi:MAG: hypothetical protein R3F59_34630 [Myxococcota bacterium]